MSFRLGKSGEEEQEKTKTVHSQRWNLYFSLERHSVMHIQVLTALQTEPDNIYLRAGSHSSAKKQTLICGYFGKNFFIIYLTGDVDQKYQTVQRHSETSVPHRT